MIWGYLAKNHPWAVNEVLIVFSSNCKQVVIFRLCGTLNKISCYCCTLIDCGTFLQELRSCILWMQKLNLVENLVCPVLVVVLTWTCFAVLFLLKGCNEVDKMNGRYGLFSVLRVDWDWSMHIFGSEVESCMWCWRSRVLFVCCRHLDQIIIEFYPRRD
jgi:hypothetical protein